MSSPDPSISAVPSAPRAARGLNLQMLGKLVVMAGLMFGFGYALVPIYQAICEVTGLNDITKRDKGAEEFARNTQVDRSRKITVEFDANMRGTMLFKPEVNALEVHPGEIATVSFRVRNMTSSTITGQAITSVSPGKAASHLQKLDCFCFQKQTLAPGEVRDMPVSFIVDSRLPQDVSALTLSYSFFAVDATPGDAGRS